MSSSDRPVQLTAVFKGVMLPSWLALSFMVTSALGMIAFLLAMFLLKDATTQLNKTTQQLSKEIRILQIHAQDIENVLIRSRLADRKDFAPWAGVDSDQKETTTKP